MFRHKRDGADGGVIDVDFRKAVSGMGGRFRPVVGALVVVAIVLYLLGKSVVTVGAGERAVIFSKFSGVLPTQLGEGWRLAAPWVWEPTVYDVRKRPWTITIGEQVPQIGQSAPEPELTGLTRDGQQVGLDISVVYHPDPDFVWRLHQRVGPYYLDKIIRPHARAICRMVVSQYAVTEVYSARREEVQTRIGEELAARLKEWDIILDEFVVRNVQFSPEFQKAVEAKQVAIQDYERMEYLLESAEKTRQKTVIQAEGESQSLGLKGQALRSNPLTLNYEYARRVAPAVQAIITSRATVPPMPSPRGGR